jgi:hypothetical protein
MKQYIVNVCILTALSLFFGWFAMKGNAGAQYFAVGSFSSLLVMINPKGESASAPTFPPPTNEAK